MKEILLTKGIVAIVDDEDYDAIAKTKWYWGRDGKTMYATRQEKGVTMSMHRQILGLKRGDGIEVDHVNRNGLDNRRENLRICTRSDNNKNREAWGISGIKGVHWHKRKSRWMVSRSVDGKMVFIGYFKEKSDAERALIVGCG